MIHIECQTIKELNITLGALAECNLPFELLKTEHMADISNAGEIMLAPHNRKHRTEKIVVLVPRIVARS